MDGSLGDRACNYPDWNQIHRKYVLTRRKAVCSEHIQFFRCLNRGHANAILTARDEA
jgi:hypothetical protein